MGSRSEAYTSETAAKMAEICPDGFDIIIDDGPHSVLSQQFVITSYLPLLKIGGVLVIEDVQHPADLEYLKQYVPMSSEFELEIIDLRDIKGRYDDILFVIKRIKKV